MKTKINNNFIFVLSIFLIILIFNNLISIFNFKKIDNSVNELIEANYNSIVSAKALTESIERQDSYQLSYLFTKDKKYLNLFNSNKELFFIYLSSAKNNITEIDEEKIISNLENLYTEYLENNNLFFETNNEDFVKNIYFNKNLVIFEKLKTEAKTLFELNQNAMLQRKNHILALSKKANNATIILSLSIIFLIVILKDIYIKKNLAVKEQVHKENIKRLEEINKIKSDFISTVSHEFKTPLTSMGISIDLLLKNKENINNPLISIINEDFIRLKTLINDLLDISKVESKNFILEKRKISISQLINVAVNNFSTISKNENITIQVGNFNTNSLFYGDFSKLLIVINNLISNAIKYGVTDTARIIFIDIKENNDNFIFSVKDNGKGIPIIFQEKIFEKFIQIKNETEDNFKGTGLGLTICKKIIQAHGGNIWVESLPNKGCTFFFNIPKFY